MVFSGVFSVAVVHGSEGDGESGEVLVSFTFVDSGGGIGFGIDTVESGVVEFVDDGVD